VAVNFAGLRRRLLLANTARVVNGAANPAITHGPVASAPRSRLPSLSLPLAVCAAFIGAAVPLTGFSPLNHAGGVLHISSDPWRLILMPSVLLCLLCGIVAISVPARVQRLSPIVTVAAGGFVLAGCLSLLTTNHVDSSIVTLTLAVVAPIALFAGVRRTGLSPEIACGAFLAVNGALLIRDDWVFVRAYGFPSGHALFLAKFSNAPYDFHYYGLQNPDMFATYLLLPLTLSAFWCTARGISRTTRGLLIASTLICLATLALSYIRLDVGVGIVVVLAALLSSDLRRRWRGLGVLLILAAVAAFVANSTTSAYISDLSSTGQTASLEVRLRSIGNGLTVMAHHLLTGVGVGQYAPGGTPAHSSIVQAGAEMGLLGFLSITVLTGWLAWRGWTVGWRLRRDTAVAPAAAIAVGSYAVVAAASGGARLGLALGYVNVWGLSAALIAAASGEPTSALAATLPTLELPGGTIVVMRWRSWLRGHRAPVLAGVGGLVVVLAGLATLKGGGSQAPQTSASTPAIVSARTKSVGAGTRIINRWSFANGPPHYWTAVKGTRLNSASGGTAVTTGGGPQTYQLLGPIVDLRPGSYQLAVTVRVPLGGMSVSLLDLSTQKFITGYPIFGPTPLLTQSVGVTLSRRIRAEVVLSNFAKSSTRSKWLVQRVELDSSSAVAR
jgi:hypothetical protein